MGIKLDFLRDYRPHLKEVPFETAIEGELKAATLRRLRRAREAANRAQRLNRMPDPEPAYNLDGTPYDLRQHPQYRYFRDGDMWFNSCWVCCICQKAECSAFPNYRAADIFVMELEEIHGWHFKNGLWYCRLHRGEEPLQSFLYEIAYRQQWNEPVGIIGAD